MTDPAIQAREALVEQISSVPGLWTGHSGFYLQHRAYLTQLIDDDTIGCVECMFPSFEDLEFHASSGNNDFQQLGKHKNAYILRRKCDGLEQLWVKASDENVYREAMLEMLSTTLKPDKALHETAIVFLQEVITGLKSKKLRFKLTERDRMKVIDVVATEVKKHEVALANETEPELFNFFNYTLNGDHIFSSSSLANVPDAWVWLFPVPANANRKYGNRVERRYMKLEPTTGARYLSMEILCKLLVNKMPDTLDEIPAAVARIASQLQNSSKTTHDRINSFLSSCTPKAPKVQ